MRPASLNIVLGLDAPLVRPATERVMIRERDESSFRFACETTAGTEPLVYEWMLNGASVPDSVDVIDSGATISIDRVTDEHYGIFQCFVTNAYGNDHSSTFLDVVCKI